jgi:beta-1,4-mannooligosaccharide/beta-1,4-mannosyl-N-acetylglucosamine phosphorylase
MSVSSTNVTDSRRDILHRYEGNPILTLTDIPYPCNTVFNGAPVKVDGKYLLLLRIEGQQGYSFFAMARSDDGYNFTVDPEPCMLPATEGPWAIWEANGIEDPRITEVDGTYYAVYTACGCYGHRIAVATTEDFIHYKRLGMISGPGNKDGILFPEKINGLFARLDRPIGNGVGSIWISYSPDMINWGRSEFIFAPRARYWDSYRIGASIPPIRTKYGWLEIYHGVKMTSSGPIYRAGAAMLDIDNPARVIKQCVPPLISPREDYERIGDVGNVVFACGAIIEDDGMMKIYYGAADTSICVATAHIDEIVETCKPD